MIRAILLVSFESGATDHNISTFWQPAAAIRMARLAYSWHLARRSRRCASRGRRQPPGRRVRGACRAVRMRKPTALARLSTAFTFSLSTTAARPWRGSGDQLVGALEKRLLDEPDVARLVAVGVLDLVLDDVAPRRGVERSVRVVARPDEKALNSGPLHAGDPVAPPFASA